MRLALAAGVLGLAGLAGLWTVRPTGPPLAPEVAAPLPPAAAVAPPRPAAPAMDRATAVGQPGLAKPVSPSPRNLLKLLPAAGRPVPAAEPAWLHNAVAVADPKGRPMIAIVIDDLGLNRRNADLVVRLPGPLTLAFMSYADDVAAQASAARAAGHELLVHVPMQPLDGSINAGFNVLRADLPPDELRRRIAWALSRFDGYVGINNHMGSRFTADAAVMSVLLAELRRRGLLFLDSRTTAASVADAVAARHAVPFARRNIFLDNEFAADAVEAQLAQVEVAARRTGFAIAIGHPHDGTIAALAQWLPTLSERGLALAPVSAIVKRHRPEPQSAALDLPFARSSAPVLPR